MNILQAAVLTAFPALVILAALSDLTTYTIPNRLNLLLAAAFLPAALLLGLSLMGMGLNLAIGLAALVVGIGMFAAGWIGGGDAKLLAAAVLWLGLPGLPTFLIVTALAGGGLSVLLMNARSDWVRPYLATAPSWLQRLATPGAAVPYGAAIALGALVAFPHSPLMKAFHGFF